jgi:hypothetical protein
VNETVLQMPDMPSKLLESVEKFRTSPMLHHPVAADTNERISQLFVTARQQLLDAGWEETEDPAALLRMWQQMLVSRLHASNPAPGASVEQTLDRAAERATATMTDRHREEVLRGIAEMRSQLLER